MSPVNYAGGKRSLRACFAVSLQIHSNPSSFKCLFENEGLLMVIRSYIVNVV